MARKPRAELGQGIYHVTQRGNRGGDIFHDDYERRVFLEEMETTEKRYGLHVLAYCLMTNHYHLVIETKAPTLGAGMRRLGTVHAQMFNRRGSTYGHVFQERYGSVVVRTDSQVVQLFRYVPMNPVAARICSEPAAWPWSSHRAMLSNDSEAAGARARVEELLAPWGGQPGTRYASLFAHGGTASAPLTRPDALYRPPLEALLSLTPRDDAVRAALDYGYTQAQVAEFFGVSQPTVSRWLKPPARKRERE